MFSTHNFHQCLIESQPHSSFFPPPYVSLLLSIWYMSQSHFHVLAPLILKANTGWCVLMIVSSSHLSSVRLLSSEEVNTPSELWLFQSASRIPHDRQQKAVTKSFRRKQFIMAVVNIVHHVREECRLLNFEGGELGQKVSGSRRGGTKDVIQCDGKGGKNNTIIVFFPFLFGSISIPVNRGPSVSKVKTEFGSDCN